MVTPDRGRLEPRPAVPTQIPRPARAGVTWDAVKVTGSDLVDVVRAYLGDRTGAILIDGRGHDAYWLVAHGTTATWPSIPGVTVLGEGAYIAVPPLTYPSGRLPHWQVPPARGQFLTPADLLLWALEAGATLLNEWAGEPNHARRMATLRQRLDQTTHDTETRGTHRWA